MPREATLARPKYQIFVSSTYEDLKEERDTIIKAILETGNIPVGMEMFSAGDEQQWELIKRQIDDCDYYIVVIAHRYGSKDGPVSYTEKEYDYALSRKIPALGFVISDDAAWPKKKIDLDQETQIALAAFKQKVRQKMVVLWKNADELHGKVAISLSKAFAAYPRQGWVRASDDMGQNVMNELSRLSRENADLRTNIAAAEIESIASKTRYSDRVIMALVKNKFRISLFFVGDDGWTPQGETSLFRIFNMIAPFFLVEIGTNSLTKKLAVQLRKDETKPGKKLRKDHPLPSNKLQSLLGDFSTLGLIEPSPRQHPVSDEDQYWALTEFGKTIFSELRLASLFKHLDNEDDMESDMAPIEPIPLPLVPEDDQSNFASGDEEGKEGFEREDYGK